MKKTLYRIFCVLLCLSLLPSFNIVIASNDIIIEAEEFSDSYDTTIGIDYGSVSGYGDVEVYKDGSALYVGMLSGECLEYNVNVDYDNFYQLYARLKNVNTLSLKSECGDQKIVKPILKNKNTEFNEVLLGSVKLNNGSNTIKLSHNSDAALSLDYIKLVEYPKVAVENLGINDNIVNVLNATISRGTDYIDLIFNYDIIYKEEYNNSISLAGDNKINIKVLKTLDDNILRIALLDTLEYDKSYTLSVSGVENTLNIKMPDMQNIPFIVNDKANDVGKEKLEIVQSEMKDGLFTVKGIIKSSLDYGIKGRYIYADLEYASNIKSEKCVTCISGENGEFTLSYQIPDSFDEGLYTMRLYGEYMFPNYVSTESKAYISDEKLEIILDAFNNANNADSIKKLLTLEGLEEGNSEYELASMATAVLNLDRFTLDDNISDMTNIYSKMAQIKYFDIIDIVNSYCTLSVMETVNNISDYQSIENLFDKEEMAYVDFEVENLVHITEDRKIAFLQNVYEERPYSDANEFTSFINNEIYIAFNQQNGILSSNLIMNDVTVTEGQQIVLSFAFKDDQTNVKGVNINISYDSKLSEILKDDIAFNNKNYTLSKSYGENSILITLTAKNQASIAPTDKLEIISSALEAMAGMHKLDVSYEIIYSFDYMNGDVFSQKHKDSIKLTINKESTTTGGASSNSGSSGGSSGGSFGGGTVIPNITTPVIEQYNKPFVDLDSVLWAEKYIIGLAQKNIVGGRGEKLFYPNSPVTRAEYIKMLVLSLEIQDDNASCTYLDVPKDAWYYKYIAAATNKGLVMGNSDNMALPESYITRQDMAVMTYRALKLVGKNFDAQKADFVDYNNISNYAKDAVDAMTSVKIINGMGDKSFRASELTSRAQAATVCYKFLEFIGGILQ